MASKYTEKQTFDKIEISLANLEKGEYESCVFKNCNFYSADLSGFIFRECKFNDCDLSMVKLKNSIISNTYFKSCKLFGVQFNECNTFLFSTGFESCILKWSVFTKLRLKKIIFSNCDLQEADFTETDLSGSAFKNCDLIRTVFYSTNLEHADFTSAYNYSFDPERNRIKKARFSQSGVIGLLDKYNIEIE
jgi:fluoroquinolone resistance protein